MSPLQTNPEFDSSVAFVDKSIVDSSVSFADKSIIDSSVSFGTTATIDSSVWFLVWVSNRTNLRFQGKYTL